MHAAKAAPETYPDVSIYAILCGMGLPTKRHASAAPVLAIVQAYSEATILLLFVVHVAMHVSKPVPETCPKGRIQAIMYIPTMSSPEHAFNLCPASC